MILLSTGGSAPAVGRRLADVARDSPIFHPDGRRYAPAEWQLARSLATGEVVLDEEFFRIQDDGTLATFRCSAHPIYDRSGSMVAAVAVVRDATAQQRDANELAYHSSLLDTVEDAIVGTDPEFRLTVWNRGAERLYGFTAEEVLGREARTIASYAGDPSRLELERELLETDRTRAEMTAHRKDHTAIDVELISVAVRDADGELTGYLGIHRDITERKRADKALLAARRRTESILESIGDSFFAVDGEWRFTYLNERSVALAGAMLDRDVTRAELLGTSCWDVLAGLVGTAFDRALRRALRERADVSLEVLMPGTGRWMEVRAYPSSNGLAVYSRDITEQRLAEQDRDRRTHQQALVADLGQRALAGNDLQSIMDQAVELVARALELGPVGIVELVPGGDELRRAGVGWQEGPAGAGEGGAGRTSLAGYTVMTGGPVISEDVLADPRLQLAPALVARAPASAATVVIAGRDRPFAVLEAFSQERRSFSDDDVNFLQSVANVISTALERVESEHRVVEARDAERRRIARDLHDEALQELTDALAQAVGTGPAVDDVDARRRLAQLVPALTRAGQELRAAIYDLRLPGEADRPFQDLLAELVEVNRAMAWDGIELRRGDGVPEGSLGRTGIEVLRIIGEALINARRHSGAGSIRVDAWGVEGQLHVDVTDDGRGFDPGREPRGTAGIKGMHERAALLGGDLDIRSAADQGTLVRLVVPVAHNGKPAGEPVRVLLVEDHVTVREAIAGMFDRDAGFDVVAQAASLAEARLLLRDIDVAVVDLGLPDGYGGDLIEELRDVNPHAVALVLTASIDRADIARAVQSGAAGALDKTAHLAEVVDAVRRLNAGETLMPLDEVVELLRFAGRQRDRGEDARRAFASLTPREREVLQALAEGLDSQTIADRLHVTLRTERNHVANILNKLGAHSQLQALVFALRHGVVEVG